MIIGSSSTFSRDNRRDHPGANLKYVPKCALKVEDGPKFLDYLKQVVGEIDEVVVEIVETQRKLERELEIRDPGVRVDIVLDRENDTLIRTQDGTYVSKSVLVGRENPSQEKREDFYRGRGANLNIAA